MLKKTSEFWIVTEEGKKHLIFEYTNFIEVTEFGSKAKEYTPGMKELKTSNGMHVNVLEEGKYQILQLNVMGKRI